MFANYFVPLDIAIALRAAGFDEPCMGIWEHYKTEETNKLHINYLSDHSLIVVNPLEEIKTKREGLFQDKRHNSILPPWLYAAPLYDQAIEWLFTKGYNIHDSYGAHNVIGPMQSMWHTAVIDTNSGKWLWPDINIYELFTSDAEKGNKYYKTDRNESIDLAIMAAIKLLTDDTKS